MSVLPDVVQVDSYEELASAAARWIDETLRRALQTRTRVSIALSGGSTPRGAYQLLATAPLAQTVDWSQLEVYFGDERCVPPEQHNSNYRMAREALLDHVPIPESQIHRIRAEAGDREWAAHAYGALLPDALDVLLLGIGPDGHTASLFPGSSALEERQRKVATSRAPAPPRDRLTITPSVIEAARSLLVLAAGSDKARAVADALIGPAPARQVPARLARRGHWILDRGAASLLPLKP